MVNAMARRAVKGLTVCFGLTMGLCALDWGVSQAKEAEPEQPATIGVYVSNTIGDATPEMMDEATRDLRDAVREVLEFGNFAVHTTDTVIPPGFEEALDNCQGDDCLRIEAEAHGDQYALVSRIQRDGSKHAVVLQLIRVEGLQVVRQGRGGFTGDGPSHAQLSRMTEELLRHDLPLAGRLRIEGSGRVILNGEKVGDAPVELDVPALELHTVGKGRRAAKITVHPGELVRYTLGVGVQASANAEIPDGMVLIPPARVRLGCKEDTPGCKDNPERTVTVPAFLLDRSEVTTRHYNLCVKANECPEDGERFRHKNLHLFCNAGHGTRSSHPMNCVTWSQAETYCLKRGKRLPTRDEWERAARGVDGTMFPWGDRPATCANAHMLSSATSRGPGCGTQKTAPVMTLPDGVSPEGVFDLAGNVAEWVQAGDGVYIGKGGSFVEAGPELAGWSEARQQMRSRFDRISDAPAFGFRCAKSIE